MTSLSSSSPRKGARTLTTFCILLLMHTIVIMELGQSLTSQFATITILSSTPSSLPQHTIQSSISKRRILRDTGRFNRRRTTEQQHIDGFIEQFKDSLATNATSSSIDNVTAKNFAALILKGNKVYCRSSQIQSLSRARYFVQMLREGLKQQQQPMTSNVSNDIVPILIKHDDSNGCYPTTQHDKYGYPRLTWSIPANTTTGAAMHGSKSSFSNSWCAAIGMPSYKQWKDVYNKKRRRSQINNNNSKHLPNNHNEVRYPWHNKVSKAVWRGSTTANKSIYGHLSFKDLPRSRLVQISNDRPDLIDAGYHKFVGKYENGTTTMMDDESRRMLKEAIPLDDMMRYKGKLYSKVWYLFRIKIQFGPHTYPTHTSQQNIQKNNNQKP